MILIIDSGGTKLDWRAIKDEGTIEQGRTQGFHPLFHKEEDLRAIVDSIKGELKLPPDFIYYYGTGFLSQDQKQIVEDVFLAAFEDTRLEINNDLLAVARALCFNEKGIACILGTGSNSCYYNGTTIEKNIPPLGYVLGDEGSGAAMGKMLLREYSRGALTPEISLAFEKRFGLQSDQLIAKVYKEENPNQFLASFAKFIFHHQNSPVIYEIIRFTFKEFVENILLEYNSVKEYPIHFSGSIAFYFNGLLRQVLNDYQLTVGNIVETPIAGLALFHQKQKK